MKTIFITSIFAGLAVASGTLHPAEKRGVDIGNAFAQRWLEREAKPVEKRCNRNDFALCIAGCNTGCATCLPGCGDSCFEICPDECRQVSGQGNC